MVAPSKTLEERLSLSAVVSLAKKYMSVVRTVSSAAGELVRQALGNQLVCGNEQHLDAGAVTLLVQLRHGDIEHPGNKRAYCPVPGPCKKGLALRIRSPA